MMEDPYSDDMRDLIKEAGLVTPSKEFTQNVMTQIQDTLVKEEVVYQPLISRNTGILIVVVVSSVLILALQISEDSISIFDKVSPYLRGFRLQTSIFQGAELYDTTEYGILFLALMFLVQINFIKKKINTSFSV